MISNTLPVATKATPPCNITGESSSEFVTVSDPCPESTLSEPVGPNLTTAPACKVRVTPVGICNGQVTTRTCPVVHVVLAVSAPQACSWGTVET